MSDSIPTSTTSDSTRRQRLAQAIQTEVVRGGRVETQSDYNAVIRYEAKTNHVLHLILSILTVGLWAFVWVTIGIINMVKNKAVTLSVDEFGNVLRQQV